MPERGFLSLQWEICTLIPIVKMSDPVSLIHSFGNKKPAARFLDVTFQGFLLF